ncbi:MAG: polyprenyl synthetase family protein [Chlamydiales bacterium]
MDWTECVDQRLKGWVESSGASGELKQAAEYALFSGGKRIRPLCTLALLQDLGVEPEAGLDAVCSLELVHTYSLVHDDLPCMDNDDFRRGKPSLHKAFSEATAVLTGDFFLTLSFEILAGCGTPSLVSILGKAAGARGLIEGQMMDLTHSGDYVSCSLLKTGALFSAAFAFAGAIANQPVDPLARLGAQYGLIYQWLDDLEDGDTCVEDMSDEVDAFLEAISPFKQLQKVLKFPNHVPSF